MVPETILEQFDRQIRRDAAGPDGLYVGNDWAAVLWPPPDGDVEGMVARIAGLPGHVEWKYYAHDPADIPGRLLAAGLVPEAEEALLVAEAVAIAPPDVEVEVELAREAFVELAHHVFGRRYELPEESLAVVVRVDGRPVSGGRVDLADDVEFAGLFGGVTLPEYRGRGFYRATVAKRAEIARERGYRYLYVDALPTSRPILERNGFVAMTTTTPFVIPREAR